MPSVWVVLGNQLFPPRCLEEVRGAVAFMAEDYELCTYHRFHKHRLVFYLSAMRHYARELRDHGHQVIYHALENDDAEPRFEEQLIETVKAQNADTLLCFEVEDKFLENRLLRFADDHDLELEFLPSPLFLWSRREFEEYLADSRRPFMKTFYETWRRRSGVMMKDGEPWDDRFSFDTENREKLPKDQDPPKLEPAKPDDITREVMDMVNARFPDHPGEVENFWLPVTRTDSEAWLQCFLEERFKSFGPYQDAITPASDFVYHSVISPMLNVGLLLPDQVIDAALEAYDESDIPIASLEGFVRQVAGWREFVRGIYQNFSEKQDTTNFWDHQRSLTQAWYSGDTGIPPLDHAIQKAVKYSYNHHIERLMIIGNLMLLCEIHPNKAHAWFMEMYADSSDWVMGPNVYGMALFSDGGIFATKPYISGSNYIRKMSHYSKGPWCDIWDGLYWRFIQKHRDYLNKNPRMSRITGNLDRMSDERRERIFEAAEGFLERYTQGE
jgi:deoxyribodipyrimidine photolyase-related protein